MPKQRQGTEARNRPENVTISLVSHKEQEQQEVFHARLEDPVTSIDEHYITQMVKGRLSLLDDRCFRS